MSRKKKMVIMILSFAMLSFLYFAYNSKPKTEYNETDYLLITSLGDNLYCNKYNIEQVDVKGYKHADTVGNTENRIYITAIENKTEKRWLFKYALKGNNLVIDEEIDLYNIKKEENSAVYNIIGNDLYYFSDKSRELIKYNIKDHRKELLLKMQECGSLLHFDGKYVYYVIDYNFDVKSPDVISIYKNKKKEDVIKFMMSDSKYYMLRIVPGKDIALILTFGHELYNFDLKTKEKKYIRDLKTFSFEPVDSGEKIIYQEHHLSLLRYLLYGQSPSYFDFIILNLKTGKMEKVYSQGGTYIGYMVMNLNDYPAFRATDDKDNK